MQAEDVPAVAESFVAPARNYLRSSLQPLKSLVSWPSFFAWCCRILVNLKSCKATHHQLGHHAFCCMQCCISTFQASILHLSCCSTSMPMPCRSSKSIAFTICMDQWLTCKVAAVADVLGRQSRHPDQIVMPYTGARCKHAGGILDGRFQPKDPCEAVWSR